MAEFSMGIKKLTSPERKELIGNAKDFYKQKKKEINGFNNKSMYFGIELEHTLLNQKDLLPAFGLGVKIVKKLKDPGIKQEYGSFQIEQNSIRHTLKKGSFIDLLDEIRGQRKKIGSLAEKNGAYIFSAGLTPKFPPHALEEDFLSKDLAAIEESIYEGIEKPVYFTGRHHEKICIDTTAEAWSIINSMHIHFQARNANETVRIYRYSQMLIPLITAISSNATYFNSLLNEEDVRMSLICGKRKSLHGEGEGFYMDYPKSIDDFFGNLFKINPWLRYEKDGKHTTYLDFMSLTEVNKYFVQIRLEKGKKNPIRIEFKITSIQPTTQENVAIAMFYILLAYYLMKIKSPLVPIEKVYKDSFSAMKTGINTKLNFFIGRKPVRMEAYRLLDELLPRVTKCALDDGLINEQESKILLTLEDRALNATTPSVKLRKIMKLDGEKKGLERFIQYSHKDIFL